MQKVCRYVTDDGQEFENSINARKHEIILDTQNEIKEILGPAVATGRADAVVRSMANHAVMVRNALNKMIRRMPRNANSEQD